MKNILAKLVSSLTMFMMVFSSFGALTAQAVAVESNNPGLGGACGLDIALVMDTSTSIDNTELGTMKTAFHGFVNTLLPSTPTMFSLVQFDDSASTVQPFTGDASVINTAITGTDGSGSTNWEDGLLEASSTFDPRGGHPNLIIFASDGNPNRTNAGSTTEALATAAAVTVADGIKTGGTRIITIGIGGGSGDTQALDPVNLIAISSADAYYETDGFDDLGSTLQIIATDLCGGTISAHKVIDRDGDLQTTDDQSAGDGWDFMVAGQPKTTDEFGNTASVSVDSAGPWDVTETPQDGYTFISASCDGASDNGSPVTNGVGGIMVNEDNIVSCTFYNMPGSALGLTVIKNVINDNEGTANPADFTLDVSMAVDSQANPFDAVSFDGDENGTLVNLPGDTYYVVGEQNPGSYSVTYSEECSGMIGVGESRTCTVTNNDLPPEVGSLTVVKVVVNDNNGTKQVSDFPLFRSTDSVPLSVTSGVANIVGPGSYTVSETNDPEEYNASFSGDCDANGTVSVGVGESKTCVITNNDILAELPQCSDGIDNDGDGEIDYGPTKDQGCDSPSDNDETGGDSGGGGGGGGSKKKSSSGSTVGQVLGEQAPVCSFAIDTYMRRGYKNNNEQVKILQALLNKYVLSGLVVDGLYGPKTEASVKAFQVKFKDNILIPWGLTSPTGIFFRTTLVQAKNLECPVVILPIPTDLVNWSLSQGVIPPKAQ